MELEPNQTASSSSSQTHAASSNIQPRERTLRSGTRAKSTKDKESLAESPAADGPTADGRTTRSRTIAASSQKRPRDSSAGKGKGKEVATDHSPVRSSKRHVNQPLFLYIYLFDMLYRTRRATQPASSSTALTINEPIKDPKGKKRALPEPASDDESSSQPAKRAASYSLRSRKDSSSQMPKKNR